MGGVVQAADSRRLQPGVSPRLFLNPQTLPALHSASLQIPRPKPDVASTRGRFLIGLSFFNNSSRTHLFLKTPPTLTFSLVPLRCGPAAPHPGSRGARAVGPAPRRPRPISTVGPVFLKQAPSRLGTEALPDLCLHSPCLPIGLRP